MLKVWLGCIRSYWVHCHYGSILSTLVLVKLSHSLKEEDLVSWYDLWMSLKLSSALLLAPCLWEKQVLAVCPRAYQPSLVTLYPEKKRVGTLYPSPIPRPHWQGEKACDASGQGGPGSSTLNRKAWYSFKGIWSKARWMSHPHIWRPQKGDKDHQFLGYTLPEPSLKVGKKFKKPWRESYSHQ